MATESYIQLPEDQTGKKVRTLELAVGSNTVHQEVMVIADENGNLLKGGQYLKLADSTTTALGASATYTGSSVETSGYKQIVGTVYADVDGTLKIQQSSDGTNWDVETSISVTGGSGKGFSIEVVAPYMRVVYENGGTAQSAFRLYVFLRVV